MSASRPRARETGREQNADTCPRVAKRFGALLAGPKALFEGFRHRSSGRCCRSRCGRDEAICVVGISGLSASRPRARETGREQNAYTCPRVPKRFGALLAVPSGLFGGFRHRSCGTFCRSRRAEAICVVGTPAFQLCCKAVFPPYAEVEPSCSDREKIIPSLTFLFARLDSSFARQNREDRDLPTQPRPALRRPRRLSPAPGGRPFPRDPGPFRQGPRPPAEAAPRAAVDA